MRLLTLLCLVVALPAAAKQSTGYFEHWLPDGGSVLFLTGQNGKHGIYHVDAEDRAMLIDTRHPYVIGLPEGKVSDKLSFLNDNDVRFGTIYTATSPRIAYALVGADMIFIRSGGDHKRVDLIPKGHLPVNSFDVVHSEVREINRRHYLFIGVSTNKDPDQVHSVVISDSLVASPVTTVSRRSMLDTDKVFSELFHALAAQAEVPRLSARDAFFSNGAKPEVIAASALRTPEPSLWAKEAAPNQTPATGPIQDVEVLNQAGASVSALALIKPFAANLTDAPGAADQIAADPDTLNKILSALANRENANVALVGAPGTGKTTEAKILAREITAGRVPGFLKGYTVMLVNSRSIEAGGSYVGAITTKVEAMLALSRVNKILWVFDEVHSLKGVGTHIGQATDVIQIMKPDLANGTFRMIGISTLTEFSAAFASDRAFMERFTVVEKAEPAGERLKAIILGWAAGYGLNPPPPRVLEFIIQVSNDFDAIGAQPRKAIRLLDAIYAHQRISGFEGVAPSLIDVHRVARERLGFDESLTSKVAAKQRLQQMTEHLDREIVGQEDAKKVLRDNSATFLSGLHDRRQPRMKVLFTGPKGTGKTSLAIEWAIGMNLPYEVIEMSQFARGARPGQGPLALAASALARNAFTVLIFDEIEKCPPELQEELLRALNEGRAAVQREPYPGHVVTDVVDFRNASVIFTANAGAAALGDKPGIGFVRGSGGLSAAELRTLSATGGISDVLLDRVDDVVAVRPLSKEAFAKALAVHLDKMLDSLRTRGVRVEVLNRDTYLQALAGQWSEGISAREIKRMLRPLRQGVADTVLEDEFAKEFKFEFHGGGFRRVDCETPLLTPRF